MAIGVNADGFREIRGGMEAAKEDTESGRVFLRHLKERGLRGARLGISDKCLGLEEALGETFPAAGWQRGVVPFDRNLMRGVPLGSALGCLSTAAQKRST